MDFYLRIATELPLKRLIVGGMESVYEIGRLFRNEGMDATHNPEFTTVEIYQAYGDLSDMMELAEGMISELSMKVQGTTEIEYQGKYRNKQDRSANVVTECNKDNTCTHLTTSEHTYRECKTLLERAVTVEEHRSELTYI